MAATPLLAFDRLASQPATADPAAAPALIAVLHGITGSSSQYAPFVQHLVDAAAASAGRPVEALVINLRGHGGSRDLPLPPPHTMEAAREDVLALLRHELGEGRAPAALLGHSVGAKVALSAAAQLAEQGAPLPKQVWVIDAAAGPTDPAFFNLMSTGLASLESVPQPAESLEVFTQAAADAGLPASVQQNLVSRCEPDPAAPGRFRTSYVPAVAASLLDDYCHTDLGGLLEAPPAGLQLHLIYGSQSIILDRCPEDKARFEAAMATKQESGGDRSGGSAEAVQYWQVEGASHFVPWTHPAELAAAIAPVLAPALADA